MDSLSALPQLLFKGGPLCLQSLPVVPAVAEEVSKAILTLAQGLTNGITPLLTSLGEGLASLLGSQVTLKVGSLSLSFNPLAVAAGAALVLAGAALYKYYTR